MFQPKTKRKLMSLAVASACGLMTMHCHAAEAADAVVDKTAVKKKAVESEEIQEVKVTATRYSTSLLKTPLAVTAFDQENLTRRGVTSAKDLANEIPNVSIRETNDSAVQILLIECSDR